jgi:chemotaxis protein methyltransferase CheR
MIPVQVPDGSAPILLPEAVPHLLRDLIHDRTGLYFDAGRFDMMIDKLQPLAAAHRCASYLDYYYLLKYDAQSAVEWRRVMDAFSVQETYFWREFDQIKALVDRIVPDWFRAGQRPLRIWSAACATGEEPSSIVMALNEGGWGRHPVEIYASDASEAALTKARAGVYRERSFRTLPAALRAKYFEKSAEGDVLRREVSSRINYRWANLMDPESFSDLPEMDVIFCRNVFIYFSPPGITRVVSSFSNRLSQRGHLFVGASESLLKLTSEFDLHEIGGAFVYRRRLPAAANAP